MSSVLEQFIEESRELIESSSDLLLRLERHPDDRQGLDALFRAVHTIKGNSGLFELPELTSLVHVLEDRMEKVRAGDDVLSRELIQTSLEAFDHMSCMIDEVETSGCVSPEAAAESAAILASLTPGGIRVSTLPDGDETKDSPPPGDMWLVSYLPKPDAFFCGEDPLYLVQSLPGLAYVETECVGQDTLDERYDVFQANVSYRALCHAPQSVLDDCFRYVPGQVQMTGVSADALSEAQRGYLSTLLHAQHEVLTCTELARGVYESVATVLSNVAGCLQIPLQSVRGSRPSDFMPLIAFLRRAIEGSTQPQQGGRPAHDEHASLADTRYEASATRNESRYLKIDRVRVDRLMELIGEMVVAKNGLPYVARRVEAGGDARDVARELMNRYASVSRITDEMQDAVMRMRMMPMSSTVQRLPRLVRDIAHRLGKEVELVVRGDETEADKTIIEGIADPLLHIVRNSLDHGFESPDEREAAGKPRAGTLTIEACQEGDRVVVVVSDDGRGIDTARVLAKAVDKGLFTADEAEAMSPQEALRIIFMPGFSTAEQVSDLSGRGVGMDVVMRSIEQLRGTVDIDSQPGQGTVIRIAMPLSIAVSHVMVTRCSGQLYGIPMDTVVETVRIAQADIQRIRGHRAAVLRDRIVPLFDLSSILQVSRPDDTASQAAELTVLIVRTRSGIAGLVVDGFDGSMDVILKPMEGVLASLRGYAGTALLGDGGVLLVINLEELL